MGGPRWSNEEKGALEAIAAEQLPLISQMHRLPARTYEGAKCKASDLGILLRDAQPWTPRERRTLKEIYRSNESIKKGVRRLLPHRAYHEAKAEAYRLGITGAGTRVGRDGYSWVWETVERVLADGQRMTITQLVGATGASRNALNKLCARYRGKKIGIVGWMRVHGCCDYIAVWALGSDPDAPRPARKTASVKGKEARARAARKCGRIDPFAGLIQQVAA